MSKPLRTTPLRRRLRTALAATVVAAATITTPMIAASPATAAVSNCSSGLNNATQAWGHCSSGSGSWTLTVQCYFWGANTAYGWGPGSIYATCPSWSHVSNWYVRTQQ